jgi:hypothetical protein
MNFEILSNETIHLVHDMLCSRIQARHIPSGRSFVFYYYVSPELLADESTYKEIIYFMTKRQYEYLMSKSIEASD